MNSLILDCSAGMKIFVLKNEEIFSVVDDNQKKHTDELLLSLHGLLEQAKLSVDDLDVIGVCVGPGSFTGIRVAVSIAKGLSVESKIKLVEMCNFDVYVSQKIENSVLCLEGFSNNVYARIYVDGITKDVCLTVEELVEKIKNQQLDLVFVQNEKVQNMLKKYEIISQIATFDAISCFKNKISKNEFIEINQIFPVYLRASQAEIEREKKLKGIKGYGV